MKKIFAIVLFLAAASAQAQSYSQIKQHVREYDRLAGQMEDIIGTVVTNETDPLSVHKTGDTMTGPLIVNGTITADGFIGDGAGLINLTETDPVWESEKAAYATGTPLYVESDTFQTVVNRGSTITNETMTLARDVKSRDATSAGEFGAAFGYGTTAGDYGAAFGYGTTAGDYGAAFGYGTTAGDYGAAFGANTEAGDNGAAFGVDTTAGNYGAAFGLETTAGDYGAAFGRGTTAGNSGAAFGRETTAGGYGAAFGVDTTAGDFGAAFGSSTTAGDYGAAFGEGTKAGYAGAAFGSSTTAGDSGAAFGSGTTAGDSGAAFGVDTTAGEYGAAFGDGTTAENYGAAFGDSTTAGDFGAAFGSSTTAGDYGAAFGYRTTAGDWGFSAGRDARGTTGSFVFADSAPVAFDRTNYPNSFNVRAQGGIYALIGTNVFSVSNTATFNGVDLAAGGGSGVTTNILGGTNITVRNGDTAEATIDFDATGIATGTPLYVESDTFQTVVNRGSTITNETMTLARDVKSRDATSAGEFGAAFGVDTTAGNYGAAFGENTTAGDHGAAFGANTEAGYYGAAFGVDTTAENYGAAFGYSTTAGEFGAAFGEGTTAGYYGAAFGYGTTAGYHGAAFGRGTTAGEFGAAFGRGTTAGEFGAAFGRHGMGGIGSFVFADAQDIPFDRTNYPDSFNVRAQGGIYALIGTNVFSVSNTATFNGVDLAAGGGGIDPAIASNSFVAKTGDTMTGPLTISNANLTLVDSGADLTILSSGDGVQIGQSANGQNNAVAVGYSANGYNYGAAVGRNANGSVQGGAIGYSANGALLGAAIGYNANGSDRGVAVGNTANGATYGVAVGTFANGANTNIAIGYAANAASGLNRIAIGQNATNANDNSAAIRGSLYLDGGTGLFFRTTFGSGDWGPALIVKDMSGTNELVAVDPDGNETQLSAHDVIDGKMVSVAKSHNSFTGRGIMIDLEAMAREVEKLSGAKIVTTYTVPKIDWDLVEAKKETKRIEERAAWSNQFAAFSAKPLILVTNIVDGIEEIKEEGTPDPGPLPPTYKPRPKPGWLVAAESVEVEK